LDKSLVGPYKTDANATGDSQNFESEEGNIMKSFMKNVLGEKLKRTAIMGVLGSFAIVGLAACGGTPTATVIAPTATVAAVATSTTEPVAVPTDTVAVPTDTVVVAEDTATTAASTPTAMSTETPIAMDTETPMVMDTATTEPMVMDTATVAPAEDVATSEPAATATTEAAAPEATATTADTSSAGNGTITAVLKEWAIDLSTAEVSAGTVTFTVTNAGTMGHNLTVRDSSGSTVGATTTFTPSEGAQTLEVNLSPGTYTVICSLPGHASLGQKATLVVK
jgi:uncharacterized cupredoxin-like copper-binding protein